MATNRTRSSGSARATTDHDEIREWAEARGGQPSVVRSTRSSKGPGILRIDFPGFSGEESLKTISWDDFFERFDKANLAFLFQDRTAGGRRSRFNKFVARDGASENEEPANRGSSRSTGARRPAARRTVSNGEAGSRSSRRTSARSSSRSEQRSSSTGRGTRSKAAGRGSTAGATKRQSSAARRSSKARSRRQ